MLRIRLFIGIVLLVALSAPGAAEQMYQYRDREGNLHFTDDKSNIPDQEQVRIKTFDSTLPVTTEPQNSSNNREERAASMPDEPGQTVGAREKESGAKAEKPENGDLNPEQLYREKQKLEEELEFLEARKARLSKKSTEDMTRKQLNTYEQQVRQLNRQIQEYKEKRNAFQEKVKRYNAGIESEKASSSGEAAAEQGKRE